MKRMAASNRFANPPIGNNMLIIITTGGLDSLNLANNLNFVIETPSFRVEGFFVHI